MKRIKIVLICLGLILIIISSISIIWVLEKEDEDDPRMKYKNYFDLGITSSKKPFNTHLWWEHATYGLVLVDSANQTKLFISTDKGANWSEIDLSDNTNTYKIQAGWLDGNDLWLVMCDNDAFSDDFEVFFIELDDSNDCNPIAISSGGDANSVKAFDIFKIGANFYVYSIEDQAGTLYDVVTDVDTNPFVQKDARQLGPTVTAYNDAGFGVVIGTNFFFLIDSQKGGEKVGIENYESVAGTLGTAGIYGGIFTAYSISSDRNLAGLAYDGTGTIYTIIEKDADSKNYLVSFTSGGTSTEITTYDVALQLDRNTASGVLEKAFHITEDKIYQINTKKTTQLYLISVVPTDAVWIAITDNFLMNNDGDMFEFKDLSNKVFEAEIEHGDMMVPSAFMVIIDDVLMAEGMFIQITDQYTSAGNSDALYRGTYIKDYTVGSFPAGWIDSDGANCETTIIASLDGHRNVIQLDDQGGATRCQAIIFAFTQGLNTVLEFWCTKDSIAADTVFNFYIYDDNDLLIHLRFDNDDLDYFNGGFVSIKDNFLVANTLSHFKIILDDTANTFDCYIDDILEGADLAYENNSTSGSDNLLIETDNFDTGYKAYLTSLGISTDPNYTVGDNKYIAEGLANQVVFEGLVHEFTEKRLQDIELRSQAIEMDNIFPSGDFSGSSQSIINTLITTYASYITAGTLAAGQAMGTITFAGDYTLRTILTDFAFLNNFIWYLTPLGALQFNSGAIDSLFEINETDKVWNVERDRGERATNKVNIKGAIVNGVQVAGVGANNLEDQQQFGIVPFFRTVSWLNTQSLCNIMETNVLSRKGTQPTIPRFEHKDTSVGFIQPGETMTFQFNKSDPNIPSGQFSIHMLLYNARQGISEFEISDVII